MIIKLKMSPLWIELINDRITLGFYYKYFLSKKTNQSMIYMMDLSFDYMKCPSIQ